MLDTRHKQRVLFEQYEKKSQKKYSIGIMLRHFKSNQNESTGSLDSVGSGNCLDCSEEHESGSDHEDVEGFVGEHVGLVLVLRMK